MMAYQNHSTARKKGLKMHSIHSDFSRIVRSMLAVATLTTAVMPQARAEAISGQGTWETTLQARDLDGDASTVEAYYDTVLNVTWLADVGYFYSNPNGVNQDKMTWGESKAWVAQLNLHGISGWRLPDVKPVNGTSFNYTPTTMGDSDVGHNITSTQSEFAHLYHVTLGNRGIHGPSDTELGLVNTGPFINAGMDSTWLDVEYAPDASKAWLFDSFTGWQLGVTKEQIPQYTVWAVHPGDVAAVVPEPSTCVLSLMALAAACLASRQRA
jgi:PEP-CTERM motif